jgi:hypothetical protein
MTMGVAVVRSTAIVEYSAPNHISWFQAEVEALSSKHTNAVSPLSFN